MSKARKVAKYTAAGTLTTMYGLAGYRIITKTVVPQPLTPQKAAVTVASLIALTWLATSL